MGRSKPARKYTLEELLAQWDPKAASPETDREWVIGELAGDEII